MELKETKNVLQFRGIPLGLRSSKRKYGRRQNSVTRAESYENADAEIDAAFDVGGNAPPLQFCKLLQELKKSKWKRSRN